MVFLNLVETDSILYSWSHFWLVEFRVIFIHENETLLMQCHHEWKNLLLLSNKFNVCLYVVLF